MSEKDYQEIRNQVNSMNEEQLKELAEKMLISRFQAKIRNKKKYDRNKKKLKGEN